MKTLTLLGMSAGLLILASGTTLAQESSARGFKWMGEMSFSTGGDRLYEVQYTDGSSDRFDAGDGFTFSGGILQYIGDSYGIKYAVGYKFNESRDDSVSVRASSFPIDLVPYYVSGKHRFGIGVTHHLSPELDDDLVGTFEFDSATGLVAEYSYSFFTVAYTDIDYEFLGVDIDASHLSVRMTFAF